MSKKLFRGMVTGIIAMLMMVLFVTPALAFDGRGGDVVTVASGEVVEGDLYVGGSTIIIDGIVNGDVFAAGQSLTINGRVNGGVSLAGQTITLNGEISNGARVAGQSIIVNGSIGRDLVFAGSGATINSQSTIIGDLVLAVGSTQVNGNVSGDVRGSAGSATFTNGVGGNVELQAGTLTIASGANIQGNLTYTSENNAIIQSGAAIAGMTTHHLPPQPARRDFLPVLAGVAVVWKILAFVMIFIIGLIIVLIASRRVTAMAESVWSRPWQSLGWGAVLLIVTPIAAIIVMITLIGLPLGLITLVLYGIALYLAQVPVALLIGKLILRQNRRLDSRGLMIGALALGLFVLFLLRLIPFIGWIVGLLTIVFGLGALITAAKGEAETAA